MHDVPWPTHAARLPPKVTPARSCQRVSYALCLGAELLRRQRDSLGVARQRSAWPLIIDVPSNDVRMQMRDLVPEGLKVELGRLIDGLDRACTLTVSSQ